MKKLLMRLKWFKHLPFGDALRLVVVCEQLMGICADAMSDTVDKDGADLLLSDLIALKSASCIADFLYRA
jgi:hypothetical protein